MESQSKSNCSKIEVSIALLLPHRDHFWGDVEVEKLFGFRSWNQTVIKPGSLNILFKVIWSVDRKQFFYSGRDRVWVFRESGVWIYQRKICNLNFLIIRQVFKLIQVFKSGSRGGVLGILTTVRSKRGRWRGCHKDGFASYTITQIKLLELNNQKISSTCTKNNKGWKPR